MVKGGYSVEVTDKNSKKLIWEVAYDHVFEEGVELEELGLRGFDFNLFDEEREGCVGDDVKELPYFLMLIKLWPGYWEDQLHQMNKKVDKANGIGGAQNNGRFWKFQRFSRNEFWKIIGCLLSAPTFDLGGSRLC